MKIHITYTVEIDELQREAIRRRLVVLGRITSYEPATREHIRWWYTREGTNGEIGLDLAAIERQMAATKR